VTAPQGTPRSRDRKRTDFNFETTLGGETMTKLLNEAATKGATLNLWYSLADGLRVSSTAGEANEAN
jgi:predicted ABC-type ATPase